MYFFALRLLVHNIIIITASDRIGAATMPTRHSEFRVSHIVQGRAKMRCIMHMSRFVTATSPTQLPRLLHNCNVTYTKKQPRRHAAQKGRRGNDRTYKYPAALSHANEW